jgi:hypothetical protein
MVMLAHLAFGFTTRQIELVPVFSPDWQPVESVVFLPYF